MIAGLTADPFRVILVSTIVDEVFCAVDAEAIDEMRIKNKTRDIEAKNIEHDFIFSFITVSPNP